MGLLLCVSKTLLRILLAIGVFILAILFSPGLPPNVKFEAITLTPAKLMTRNSILDKAQPLKLNKGIHGPESIAIRGDELFTGLMGGDIVKIKDDKVTTVVKTGKECHGNHWDTKNACGRPLGMRFDKGGKLVVADASVGILRVDVDKGSMEILTSIDEVIDGKKVMFPDDLDLDKDGNIYWSDASTNGGLHSAMIEFFGEPSGRLMKYDVKNKKSEVLWHGIHFPNGIQLSKNEDFVLICETVRARVLRYFLKGPRKGQHEVFVDGLPGLPDNIRPNGRGGYYVALAMPRYPYVKLEENMADVMAEKPLFRKLIMRLQHLFLSLINMMEGFTGPDVLIDQFRFTINNLGQDPENFSGPRKTIVTEIDENGKIIRNLENEKSRINGLSEVSVGPVFTYFGSYSNKDLYKINNNDLPSK